MMNRDRAIDLIRRYFKAWVDMDFDLFAGTVHDDATVRENTGAVMEGREQLHRGFAWWTRSNNEVDYRNIHRIFYDEEQQTAFVEWTFKCRYEGQEYEWDGSSAITFRDSLIYEINEYEAKKEKHYPYK